MRTYVYPYKLGSKSAIIIADGIDAVLLKPKSPYTYKQRDLVVNWGNSVIPEWNKSDTLWLNTPHAVTVAANKKLTFQKFKENGVPCPQFTLDKDEATEWVKKGTVFARTKLTSHSGQGIVVLEKGMAEIPKAPLYVKYKKKSREFRVHVFQDEVIDIQEKLKKVDFDGERNSKIRSHDNGWVFCRGDLQPFSENVYEVARQAVSALNLSFGAVDIIYNGLDDAYYALEVNTAPGIEGETMFSYVCAILNYMEAL